MIKEVLDIITELAQTGMTMICVTHEMGFARRMADRVLFMDRGEIIEQGTPDEFFQNPKSELLKTFLSRILHGAGAGAEAGAGAAAGSGTATAV
jgi:general L-amino acid transport system ATP-binding protein